MRTALAALTLMLATHPAWADVAIPVARLIASPATQVGKSTIVRKIHCVDPGKSGFVCAAVAGGKGLRIEASFLGAQTELAIAEKLIGPCKGFAGLEKPACVFDAVFTPSSQYREAGLNSPDGVTVIVAPGIEMFKPARIGR